MTDGGRAGTRGAWLWLPVATSGVLTVVMFAVGRASDPRSGRAGAEPDIAGVLVAIPFAVLLVVALVAACIGHGASSGIRASALAVVSTLAVLVAALVLWSAVDSALAGYGSVGRASRYALVVATLLLPVVPAWTSYLREQRDAQV